MADVDDAASRFARLSALVQASFPHIRCLRCGDDKLYLMPDPSGPSGLGAVTLACVRCGHVEQHLLDILESASKPIPTGPSSE